jgi:hypothetical protein
VCRDGRRERINSREERDSICGTGYFISITHYNLLPCTTISINARMCSLEGKHNVGEGSEGAQAMKEQITHTLPESS